MKLSFLLLPFMSVAACPEAIADQIRLILEAVN